MSDVLTKISARDSAPQKPKLKTASLWQVSLGNGRITKRLYPKGRARKLAARYNRLTGGDRAYVAGPLKVRLQVA
jgi:hypothetical protein